MRKGVDLEIMTLNEIREYVDHLESEIQTLTAKLNNRPKLDQRDALRIRALYQTGNWTQRELAQAFNVNDATISRIVNGVYYADA